MAVDIYTLARPYAKAAFSFAQESGEAALWANDLALLAEIIKNSDMKSVLNNPAVSSERIVDLIKACAPNLNAHVQNFLNVLAINHRLETLPAVLILFNHYKALAERTMDVDVISAFPLEENQKESLATVLSKRLDRKVNIHPQTDERLIGGLIIRAGDEVIDGSVRGRLAQLTENLMNG